MRLDRYIFGEILGPLALGFSVFTFILLLQALFKSARLIISSNVEASAVGKLLLLSMPWIVVMTIPMALLFGILIAVGRLSADSELVAIRAAGVSLFSLYRPIVVLSLALTGASTYLMVDVLPKGNTALQRLQLEIVAQSLTEEVQPRVPHTGWQNKILYVFETPPGERRWKGVFLGDAVPTQKSEVFVADWGWAQPGTNGEVMLSLENAYIHRVDYLNPIGQDVIAHKEMDIKLATLPQFAPRSVKRGLRELSFEELRKRTSDPEYPEVVHNMASVELHKKFSLPAACLVFGLLGLPLGFNNSRGGRSAGFAISLGIFLVYYVLLSSGEDIARKGDVAGWLAVWFPNFVLLVVGLFLLARRNRDKSLLLTQFDRWIQETFWGRLLLFKSRREAKRDARRKVGLKRRKQQGRQLILRLPDSRPRFPNAIDRYVLITFLRVLVLAFLAGVVVYLVFDLADNFNSFLQSEAPTSLVVDYYQFQTFSIVYQIAPIMVLVATLISFGLLSRTNEVIACKALGISLYRLAIPVVLAAACVAALCGVLQSEILPASTERATELKAMIKGRQTAQTLRADRRWLFGKGNYLFNYGFLEESQQEDDTTTFRLHRLQIFRFDDQYRMTDRLWAQRATYVEDGWWTLSNGWSRSWDGQQQETGFVEIDKPMKYRLGQGPEYFQGGLRKPEEMDYRELRHYIDELKSSGQDVPQLEVALHNKIAYPMTSLVMALVALPFAFRMGRQGALYGIGLSLVLGVILMIFLGAFGALGENNILPPIVAVWSPSGIFAIFAIYLFLGVRT